jgi:GTP-binding nuclear protein Ran
MSEKQFKVTMVGEGGVGKSMFLKHMYGGIWSPIYNPTLCADVCTFIIETSKGPIIFNCWDTAGQKKYGGIHSGYWIGSDAFMIFFDIGSRLSYQSAKNLSVNIGSRYPDKPIIIIGNKVDIKDRDKFPKNISYIKTSAKSGYNCQLPWLYLARYFTNEEDLVFIDI